MNPLKVQKAGIMYGKGSGDFQAHSFKAHW